MTTTITMRPHSLLLLVGPTMCGKSTFASYLADRAIDAGLGAYIISSDELRIRHAMTSPLLGTNNLDYEQNRHSPSMQAASKAAFSSLYEEVKQAVSYPINTEIVIVDTTGFNETFRKDMVKIGRDAGYWVEIVTFEYKDKNDYFLGCDKENQAEMEMVRRSVDTFRRKVLPELSSRSADSRTRIKNRNDNVVIEDGVGEYQACFLNLGSFAVIGDSHECVEEAKEMVATLESKYPDAPIFWVGDYVDKGGRTKEMVDFMYERIVKGKDRLITGNHENYNFKVLTGQITNRDLAMEAVNFSSAATLTTDHETAKKFLEIHQKSKPFYCIMGTDGTNSMPVILTHAPCSNKYLTKFHSYAIAEQRNYRSKDRTQPWLKELEWFYDEADFQNPLHIFGHVAHKVTKSNGHRYKDKFFLDTGCVYGNCLTAAVVYQGDIADILEVKSSRPVRDEKLALDLGYVPKKVKAFDIADFDLSWAEHRLIKQMEENQIRYISGTMSPAPSTETELEPLVAAFDYFKKRGVTQVILQPKYMGSRCQTYLFKDAPEKTFQTSRAGWKIRGLEGKTDEEYQAFLKDVYDEYCYLFDNTGLAGSAVAQESVILDGELLPWRALGAGLIDNAFTPYRAMIQSEVSLLANDAGFAALTEFAEKIDVGQKLIDIAAFDESLSNYTQDTPPQFKAFDVLAIDGLQMTGNSASRYALVNSDAFVLVHLGDETSENKGHAFFETLTVDEKMEGVVVKPVDEVLHETVPPYMKVRSPEYLRLVYGYDYTSKLDKLCRQKNIQSKVRLSIDEHRAMTELLTATGERRTELVVKMIGSLKQEKALDPRL